MKRLKIISIAFLLMLMISNTFAFATASDDFNPATANINYTQNEVNNVSSSILKIITVFGSALSVIMLIILGLKYMIGAPGDKSEFKKSLIPYIVGACILFASSSIATIIYNSIHKA